MDNFGSPDSGDCGTWCGSCVVALNGGPPLVRGCSGSHLAADRLTLGGSLPISLRVARALPGGEGSARQGILLGGVLCWLAAVEDDLFHVTSWVR